MTQLVPFPSVSAQGTVTAAIMLSAFEYICQHYHQYSKTIGTVRRLGASFHPTLSSAQRPKTEDVSSKLIISALTWRFGDNVSSYTISNPDGVFKNDCEVVEKDKEGKVKKKTPDGSSEATINFWVEKNRRYMQWALLPEASLPILSQSESGNIFMQAMAHLGKYCCHINKKLQIPGITFVLTETNNSEAGTCCIDM